MSLPLPPNAHALAVLALTVLALVLFTREKRPLEFSRLLLLISLTVGFDPFLSRSMGGSRTPWTAATLWTRKPDARLCPDDWQTGA